jgi:beta-phosphoglucomutase
MQEAKAFLFDLNGTMIDDMDFHIKAWYNILNDLGADISMARVKENVMVRMMNCWNGCFPAGSLLKRK